MHTLSVSQGDSICSCGNKLTIITIATVEKKRSVLVLSEIRGVGLSDWGCVQKCNAARPTCDRCTAVGISQGCFYKERPPRKRPTLKGTAAVSPATSQINSPVLCAAPAAFSSPSSSGSRQHTFSAAATTALTFPVNASDPSSVGSANPLDVDPNSQIPGIISLGDLDTSL